MGRVLKYLFWDEKGATAIEYALIVALISLASVVAMTVLGQSLNDFLFEGIDQNLQDAAS